MIKALKDEEYNVRRNAAEALGKIGDERAVQPLIEASKMEEKDYLVKPIMEEALRKLQKQIKD